MNRTQKALILADLEKKIVLLVGPRQAGKTWIAKNIAAEFPGSIYLNYDQVLDRDIMLAQSWLPSTPLLVLDELHKMPNWKNYLKGVFDTRLSSMRILVTGSARLDVFDQLGDSLAGRYFRHRLLPLSLAELKQVGELPDYERLLTRGGFPEPYLATDDIESKRWRMQYINSMLSTDIFELDKILNLKAMRLVFELLRTRVGSPISYQSLAEDCAVSPVTIKKYIHLLEALYVVFRVTPYAKNIARSLLKEPKLYFFDTGLVQGDDGAKLENMVAVELLKHVYARTDYQAEECVLHYLRTKDGLEVDFAIATNDAIESIIEVKLADHKISKTLHYFQEKYGYQAIQLVGTLRHEVVHDNITVRSAEKFLATLTLK